MTSSAADQPEDVMPLREVLARLEARGDRVNLKTLQAWCRQGLVAAHKDGGRWLVRWSSVEARQAAAVGKASTEEPGAPAEEGVVDGVDEGHTPETPTLAFGRMPSLRMRPAAGPGRPSPIESVDELMQRLDRASEEAAAGVENPEAAPEVSEAENPVEAASPPGHWERRHANGRRACAGRWVNGELQGPWREWCEDGHLRLEGLFNAGKREGRWTWWHANGEKLREGEFLSGRPEGEWLTWSEDGTLVTREIFRAGVRQR